MQEKMKGSLSLAEEVTAILRDRILNGAYEMGEKLTESKIATELKVSRTPVRDAFRELQRERLIEYVPNKGCFARGFDREDVADIYEVRKVVEQVAIRAVIEKSTEEEIQQLGRQLEVMRTYTQGCVYDQLLKANEEFHEMIYRMTRSRFVVQVLRSYQDYVHYARRATLREAEDLPEIFHEHEKIFQAVQTRNKEEACAAVAEHMDMSAQRMLSRWAAAEGDR
ncbi:MAG: GntR family transcriptional regulator [Firmicutes bacterium]|nr:GntR family transcriptional regulator [Bacillota bacterium]